MPRGRTRQHRRKTLRTVKQKPKGLKVPAATYFASTGSALPYDSTKTQFANYKELGLLADANQIGASAKGARGFKPRVKGPMAAPGEPGTVHPIELEVPEAAITNRRVPEGEGKVLRALLAKHGDDFGAMARDMRINTHQHTAAHLRRRAAKLARDDDEWGASQRDAGAGAAGDGAAAAEPAPRFKRKLTHDPNPAFKSGKRRSKNFV